MNSYSMIDLTVNQLQNMKLTQERVRLTDLNDLEAIWDPADSSTPHDGVDVFKSLNDRRYKRVRRSAYDLSDLYLTLTELRAYTGNATRVQVSYNGTVGVFELDPADTTSADNTGTIAVDGNGGRWKRQFVGPVRLAWFGVIGNGVDDDTTALQNYITYMAGLDQQIANYTESNQYNGILIELDYHKQYKISNTLSVPGRTTLKGNNSVFFSDNAITLLDVYGFESYIYDLRLYKGSKAVNYTQGNVDTSVSMLINCQFSGQTEIVVNAEGTYSTHLGIKNCKMVSEVPFMYSDCDETVVEGGFYKGRGHSVSYFTSTGRLYLEDLLLVPSYATSPTDSEKLSTYWVQIGTVADNSGSLIARRVRFGGEAVMSYVKNYAKATSTANGIRRVIDVRHCELFSTGNYDLSEVPNEIYVVDNLWSVSNIVWINAASANAVAATSNMELWRLDPRINRDTDAIPYCFLEWQRNGDAKNTIATNAYLTSFSVTKARGGGGEANAADVWPTNNIKTVTFGTKTTEDQLYYAASMTTGLTGRYTFQLMCTSDTDVLLTMYVGAYKKTFNVSGDGEVRMFRVQGLLTTAATGIGAAVYYVPDNAVVQLGHPILLPGAVDTDIFAQAPSTTTLTVKLYEGKMYADSAPSDGYWYKGIKLFNITPAAGEYEGWVCAASGTPGTWKTFGAISA